MEQQRNPLQDQIDIMKRMQEAVNRTAAEHPDVKSGKCTLEDQLKEPRYLLYNQITDSVMDTLEQPEISGAFVEIGKTLGEDVSKNLVLIVGLCMARSAHNAVVFYDELLKRELITHFDQMADGINLCRADTAAFGKVMEVFKKRLEKLESEKKIADAAKEAGIDPNSIK